ncbi:MAG: methylenetetrahydrofolate reductase [NAD(P)H] [Deltaproteobacteria bacterium]|nr:MAG: methylenetetrahydrofolate reductase [NAD(P)H] [Deltaproteobacteria bacterium]
MRIVELFERGGPVFSFEFFPPKTDKGFDALFHTIGELKQLDPSFVSVTWGAGGSTRRKTIEIVIRIQRELGITAMCHLTCVGASRDELAEILDQLAAAGIENVLPLRGDPPRGEASFAPVEGGFRHANELIEFIRSRWDFCLPAACYPETHTEAPSPEVDLRNLVRKVRAGVDFLITQLFFDNRDYFDFVGRARAAGIGVPIVPGIMPVTSTTNVPRIAKMCGSKIPAKLEAALAAAAGDGARIDAIGVRWATDQCRELLERGAPGIHFYTLNRSPATRRIYRNLFPE